MSEERLAALEARLLRVEDELAVTRLIASYGPLVDAGAAAEVAEMWTEDGEYDVEGWHMRDRGQVRAMVESTAHQSL
ncbi:nuclear transport factor 2 family protein, partial [Nocardia tengchongensis]